jgi:uncharacterized protein with HEPN domain
MSGHKDYFRLLMMHCDKIFERIENFTLEDWRRDDTLQDAVCMRLMALAECVKVCLKKNPSLSDEFPDIPWTRIARFRDRIAHHYENVDIDVIWDIITSQLEPLYSAAREVANQNSATMPTAVGEDD